MYIDMNAVFLQMVTWAIQLNRLYYKCLLKIFIYFEQSCGNWIFNFIFGFDTAFYVTFHLYSKFIML